MKHQVQKNYLNRKKGEQEKDRKKEKDRLRYIFRKESKEALTSGEKLEKRKLEEKKLEEMKKLEEKTKK